MVALFLLFLELSPCFFSKICYTVLRHTSVKSMNFEVNAMAGGKHV